MSDVDDSGATAEPARPETQHWRALVVTVLLLLIGHALGPLPAEDRLQLLDGTILTGRITAIDAAGTITGNWRPTEDGKPAPTGVNRSALRSIEHGGVAALAERSGTTIRFANGGTVLADRITVADDQTTIVWHQEVRWTVPLDRLAGFAFTRQEEAEAWRQRSLAAIARRRADGDDLLLPAEDRLRPIAGSLISLADNTITFRWNDADKKITIDKLAGLRLAKTQNFAPGHGRVELRDGSQLHGDLRRLAEGTLTLAIDKDTTLDLPWAAVRRIRLQSERIRYLSDLEPQASDQAVQMTWQRSPQRDRSIDGNPLHLRGRRFDKGLGVHARTRLRFARPTGFTVFAATVGIDDETKGRGNCVFIVKAGDKELWRQAVDGEDPAVEVRLDLTTAETVELIVDYGEDFDLADHANWCEARFEKPAAGAGGQ